MRRALVLGALTVAMLLTACNEEDDMGLQERAEERAAQARAHVDDLARRVGQDPEIRMDELTDCIPGQEDSGIDLVYIVRVQTVGDSERVLDDVSNQMASEGWRVVRDPDSGGTVKARFGKDGFSMGARISTSSGLATISGTGGCVQ